MEKEMQTEKSEKSAKQLAREEQDIKLEQEMLSQDVLLAWEILDGRQHERGPLWYIIASMAAIGLIIFAIFTQAWTLAVAVSLLAGVMYLLSQEPTGIITVIVTRAGIYVNRKFYPLGNITSYWLATEGDSRSMYVRMSGKLNRTIHIELGKQDPTRLRDVCVNELKLTEEPDQGEHFVDMLARKWKL